MNDTSYINISPTLPWEVIGSIISHVVDHQTLLSLCITTRFIGKEATKSLYRVIDYPHDRQLQLKLLPSLISRPQLASLVHTYSSVGLTTRPLHDEQTLQPLVQGETNLRTKKAESTSQLLSLLLAKALPLMVNLKRFSFTDQWQYDGERNAEALLLSGAFQLERFVYGNKLRKAALDFLEKQYLLKSLAVLPNTDIRIPHTICDRLMSLSARQSTIEAILPFAPRITHLNWSHTDPDATFRSIFDLPSNVGQAMRQLTHFSYQYFITRNPITAFEGAVDNLTSLLLEGMISEEPELTFISGLKKLKLFVLRRCACPKKGHCVAVKLLEGSSSIEYVVICSPGPPKPRALRTEHMLYTRGSFLPRQVDWEWRSMERYFQPVCLQDTKSPGWIDQGPYIIPSESDKYRSR